jgi:hypothetical protein
MLGPFPVRSIGNLRASSAIAGALLFVTAAGISAPRAAEHTLMPSPKTVHIGYFLATVKPVLTIDSGDIVTIESAASIVPAVVDRSGVVPTGAVPQYQRDIYGEVKDRGPGPHILTGPIEVRGAEPGDVLEVRILDVALALDWGCNRQRSYTGALPDEFTALWSRIIPIDRQAKTAQVAKGVVVPVDRPFFTELAAYLRIERPSDCGTEQCFVVLRGPTAGQPLTEAGMRRIFRTHRARSGAGRVRPHRLRHTYGTELAAAGIDLLVLRDLMGHASPETTGKYVHLSAETLAAEYTAARQASPW